jgi:hypothetical protein
MENQVKRTQFLTFCVYRLRFQRLVKFFGNISISSVAQGNVNFEAVLSVFDSVLLKICPALRDTNRDRVFDLVVFFLYLLGNSL